eukprot:gene34556-41118_t
MAAAPRDDASRDDGLMGALVAENAALRRRVAEFEALWRNELDVHAALIDRDRQLLQLHDRYRALQQRVQELEQQQGAAELRSAAAAAAAALLPLAAARQLLRQDGHASRLRDGVEVPIAPAELTPEGQWCYDAVDRTRSVDAAADALIDRTQCEVCGRRARVWVPPLRLLKEQLDAGGRGTGVEMVDFILQLPDQLAEIDPTVRTWFRPDDLTTTKVY